MPVTPTPNPSPGDESPAGGVPHARAEVVGLYDRFRCTAAGGDAAGQGPRLADLGQFIVCQAGFAALHNDEAKHWAGSGPVLAAGVLGGSLAADLLPNGGDIRCLGAAPRLK